MAAFEIAALLHETLPLGGDVCEFGVAQGRTSALIAHEIALSGLDAYLHLYDSFEGLPAPTEEDQLLDDIFNLGDMAKYAGTMSVPEEEVRQNLLEIAYSKFQIHKGYIAADTPVPRAISFAYLDMDLYAPTLLGLQIVWPALCVNGAVMIDDYGFFSSGAKAAVDEFFGGRSDALLVPAGPGAGPFMVARKVY